jgi:hypothetical protein
MYVKSNILLLKLKTFLSLQKIKKLCAKQLYFLFA